MKNLEDKSMILGIFLGLIPLLGILLGYFKLFYWPIVLVVALLITWVLVIPLIQQKSERKYPSVPFILVLIITIAFFAMMYKGTMSQPWLENHDPYGYAIDSLYIAEEHTTLKDKDIMKGGYLEPDPPGYSVFMAFFYQIWGNMNWTLKFMNVLILSLGLIFAYLFFKEFLENEYKALFAVFILAAIPSFLTRFIFATSLAVSLFFPALYATIKSREKPRWIPIAALLIGSILVTHHLSGFVFGLFFIVFLFFDRKVSYVLCGFFGVIGSLLFWIPNIIRYGFGGIIEHFGLEPGESAARIVGSATREYTFIDFITAPSQNMINTSTGWGLGIFIMVVAAIAIVIIYAFKKKPIEIYMKTALIWFIISLIAVNAFRLPFMLMPFRWWTFLAIPVAVLCADAMYKLSKTKNGIFLIIGAIFLIIIFSWVPKYQINAHPWNPSRSLTYPGLMEGHMWLMENLPENTPIYSFNQGPKLAGFNMYFCAWCKEDMDMEDQFLNVSPTMTRDFIKDRGYDYLILNTWYFDRFGNQTANKFEELLGSGLFRPVHQTIGMITLEVE